MQQIVSSWCHMDATLSGMATRRDKGSGALFKRADGYWVGGVQLPPGPDGKRRYKRIVRKNRNEAMAALRQLKADAC